MVILSYHIPMTPRYLIVFLVPLFLMAAISVRCDPAFRYIAILALVLSCIGLAQYYSAPIKDDWRPIPAVVGASPVAVVGPEFVPAFERYEEYHSLPLRYYCPECNITDPWSAEYIVQVNEVDGVIPGELVWDQGGLKVFATHKY